MPFFPEISIFSRSSAEWSQLLYDDRPMCSIPAPFYYSISSTGAHLFSCPFYLAAFYALYCENSSGFRGYKRYLGFHAICNFLFEFYLSVLMKPVLYLPHRVARFAGPYFFKYLNGALLFYGFLILCVATTLSILEMIHYRFKLVTELSISESWVRQWIKVVKYWVVTIYLLATGVLIAFAMCLTAQFEQPEIKMALGKQLITEFPEIMCSSALVVPIGTWNELKPIHVFNFLTLFANVSGFFLCTAMSTVILLSLKTMITRCSQKTIQMHRLLLYSIFVQVTVHGLMLGFPILIYVLAMILSFDGNDVGYLALIIASLHGAMSTLSMLIFNKPLLKIVNEKLRKWFTPNYVQMVTVSFISADFSKRRDTVMPA